MSALVVLIGLLAVIWYALGHPRLRSKCSCGEGRSVGLFGSLFAGTIALALFGRLVEHRFLVGLVIAAVGFAVVILLLVLLLRARR